MKYLLIILFLSGCATCPTSGYTKLNYIFDLTRFSSDYSKCQDESFNENDKLFCMVLMKQESIDKQIEDLTTKVIEYGENK
ncbi:MAG TPA: hypothetical protein VIJ14_04145 [Rhabdochlamydiaceae bacterium]